MQARERWSLLDLIRIFGGIIVILISVLWQLGYTRTNKWGKWGTFGYWRHRVMGSPQKEFSAEELWSTKGSGKTLVALNKTVYDVSSNAEFYMNSRYVDLVGRDCSVLFITGAFGSGECEWDFSSYENGAETIAQWEQFFDNKYFSVGTVLV